MDSAIAAGGIIEKMNTLYLTDRATQNRGWHIPVGIVSLLLAAATFEVWIEDSPVGEDFFTWLLAYITVLGAVLLPLYFIVR